MGTTPSHLLHPMLQGLLNMYEIPMSHLGKALLHLILQGLAACMRYLCQTIDPWVRAGLPAGTELEYFHGGNSSVPKKKISFSLKEFLK